MCKQGENLLRSFDRIVLGKIFDLAPENGFWSRRKISEMYKRYDEHDVLKFVKLGRLRRAGHVMRMEESDPALKVLQSFVPNKEEIETGEAVQS